MYENLMTVGTAILSGRSFVSLYTHAVSYLFGNEVEETKIKLFFYLVIVLYVLPLTSHLRLWKKRRNKTKLSIKQNIYLQITGVKPFHSITQHYSKHSVNLTKNKTTSRNICKTTLKFYQVYVISSKAQVS